ncbi:MAG: GNAT family N-acetyltransferase [Pseudomonadota bacterium]
MAALHARCFDAAPPPWSAAAFAATLAAPGGFALIDDDAFLIGRAIGPDAELLTLAVAPECRRRGLARDLLERFHARAHARGAQAAFLEVAASNQPARALYTGAGYTQTGMRPGYFAGADALVLRKALA